MMLLPNKNSHPDLTIISVSSFLLSIMRKDRVHNYFDLLSKLSNHDKHAVYLFTSSLELLFLLGLLQYHIKSDTLEYTGQ
jgi:aspartate aminotransferase-like enzyme